MHWFTSTSPTFKPHISPCRIPVSATSRHTVLYGCGDRSIIRAISSTEKHGCSSFSHSGSGLWWRPTRRRIAGCDSSGPMRTGRGTKARSRSRRPPSGGKISMPEKTQGCFGRAHTCALTKQTVAQDSRSGDRRYGFSDTCEKWRLALQESCLGRTPWREAPGLEKSLAGI